MKKAFLLFAFICVLISTQSFCASNTAMERAITLYKWKFYDDSITELNKLISDGNEPWTSRAMFLKATCLAHKGDTASASDIFNILSARRDFPLSDYARFSLGEMSFGKKKYEEACGRYGDIPADSALRSEAGIRIAECLFMTGKVKDAIEIYKALITENSSLTQLDKARFNLGKCYEKAGMPREAIRSYHEVDTYYPLSPLVKEAVARISSLSNRYKIYPGAATAEDIFNKAQIYYTSGDFRSAGATYLKIVTSYRKSDLWEEALFKLALCDYKRKRLSSAVTRFKLCVRQGGDFADAAQFYLSFTYGKAGYFYQALDSLNKVAANYPNSQYADEAAYYIGYYYETNGFKDTALECYNSFVQKYPKSNFLDDAYWRIGRIYYFRKDYSRACDAFSKAIWSCSSGDWLDACAYWKAMSQEKMGNEAEAISSYQFVMGRYDHTYYGYRA
jgi:TolA-binding protein